MESQQSSQFLQPGVALVWLYGECSGKISRNDITARLNPHCQATQSVLMSFSSLRFVPFQLPARVRGIKPSLGWVGELEEGGGQWRRGGGRVDGGGEGTALVRCMKWIDF